MKPTILEGDRVFVNKLAYDLKFPFTTWHIAAWGNPQRGDIVVFYSPHDGKRLIKRVVGLPGDTLEMRNEHLLVNGQPVAYDPLLLESTGSITKGERSRTLLKEQLSARQHAIMVQPDLPARRTFGPVEVPAGHYFMLGDNRDDSFDSRFYGPVARGRILGRATAVILSFDPQRCWLPRLHRFLVALDTGMNAGKP